jgi:transcriptional regulator with XRE-family HTH domain
MNTPHPVDVHVGRRLRLRRTILGMSQESIGTAIGVTFQQVQKYERGVNRMGSSRLFEFSKILSVPVAYFFEEFDANAAVAANSVATGMAEDDVVDFEHEQLTSRETMEMMRAYYRIPSYKVRKGVFDLVKTLAEPEQVA